MPKLPAPSEQALFASDQPDLLEKSYEEERAANAAKPVECLGQTFPNDAARREHYLQLLAKKLNDPEFRKLEGFPEGKDEDILALSDPPYYTACPNPWLVEFVKHYGSPYDAKSQYGREPYVADVTEGKSHPIYNAHSYHTKVPHRAIMRYILHYTNPGDLIFDGFSGTGMAGVAAQLCGDKLEIQSLNYKLRENGDIFDEEGKHFSKLGPRRVVLNDLSPAATFISYNYNAAIDLPAFEREARRILKETEEELAWMYQTLDKDGISRSIETIVWSELFTCPQCAGKIVFLKEALNPLTCKVRDTFSCPHCDTSLNKDALHRFFEVKNDSIFGTPRSSIKYEPCIIKYHVGKRLLEKTPDENDIALNAQISKLAFSDSMPSARFPIERMYHGTRIEPKGFTHVHHFYLPRIAHTLAKLWETSAFVEDRRISLLLRFWLDSQFVNLSIQNRYRPEVSFPYNPLGGVYYIPGMVSEASPFTAYRNKLKRLAAAFSVIRPVNGLGLIETASTSKTSIPDQSIDYIFTDPPFGENIFYADMNFLTESWHRVITQSTSEAIIDNPKGKGLLEYQSLMLQCFREYFRVLKPGRWITVEFSNSKAAIWNAIQTAMQDAGFVVANVAALDKQQRSFRSVTTPTAVKQDLVISAYKPNGGLEERFVKVAQKEQGSWEFVRSHLKYLPVVKQSGGELEFVTERDPRIIFDRMVAFYFQHGINVPMNSSEFQAGLEVNFSIRDGMVFLPEQALEYDRRKLLSKGIGQRSLLVDDERSAIDWLTEFLKRRPSESGDIAPEFMEQLRGSTWKKGELRPELSALLRMNFLRYDGSGDVPSQIHSYLSTNFAEMRNREKSDPGLKAKAKDRWYVPDPNNAIQIEQMRERDLLRDFDGYQASKDRKIKEFRIEALRAGFKKAWQEKRYDIIISVAAKIPENVIQEDPKLLMWHTNACTRAGVEN